MDSDDQTDAGIIDTEASTNRDLSDLLSDPHVRYLLQYLHQQDGPVDVPTVATHVVAGVTNTPPADVPKDVRNRVQTFLHHGHIPQLEAHGIVEYDAELNTIKLVS
jgi:hypothetical protein